MATKRTTHRSSAGKKLYAVRDKKGSFKDIQTYKKAHGSDVKRKAKAELRKLAKQLRAAVKIDKTAKAQWRQSQENSKRLMLAYGVPKRDPAVTAFMKTFRGFVTSHFGKRCKTMEHGCSCCQMWKAYDLVDTMIV